MYVKFFISIVCSLTHFYNFRWYLMMLCIVRYNCFKHGTDKLCVPFFQIYFSIRSWLSDHMTRKPSSLGARAYKRMDYLYSLGKCRNSTELKSFYTKGRNTPSIYPTENINRLNNTQYFNNT